MGSVEDFLLAFDHLDLEFQFVNFRFIFGFVLLEFPEGLLFPIGDFIYINQRLLIRRVLKQSETTQTLANNQRQTEDKLLLDKLLPTSIAKIVSKAYSIAYKSNG